MNTDLIQRLDDQAYDEAWNGDIREDESVGQLKRERFAELIVRECHLSITKYINDCGEVSSFPIEILLKHFGLNDD